MSDLEEKHRTGVLLIICNNLRKENWPVTCLCKQRYPSPTEAKLGRGFPRINSELLQGSIWSFGRQTAPPGADTRPLTPHRGLLFRPLLLLAACFSSYRYRLCFPRPCAAAYVFPGGKNGVLSRRRFDDDGNALLELYASYAGSVLL